MQEAGRYRLTRRLGQGGMAEVFEGYAEGAQGFRRRVAIKRVLPQLASDAACARMFLDEARIASHLHHAGIVSVLDYGTIDGLAFQALEFVDGMDLDQLLRKADERGLKLDTGLALHIVMQVAAALDHAHDARDEHGNPLQIVHRDVSPSNVLISWDGHVKLSDFGIALAANRLERTEGAGIKGKLEYMAPEQALRGNVDRRTDVFALGCSLHRLLTGRSPLSDFGVLARLAAGDELVLDESLDPEIREVIRQATRVSQTQRYASAKAFVSALRPLVRRYLQDDATLALQSWLERVRAEPNTAKLKRGALDQLLHIELVLAGGTDQGERTFTAEEKLATTIPQPGAPTIESERNENAPSETDLERTNASATRAPRASMVALAALVLSAFLAGVWWLAGSDASSERLTTLAAPPLPPISETKTIVTEATGAEPATEEVRTEAKPREEPGTQRESRATRKREAKSVTTVTEPKQAEPALEKGTLVIGGDGALRAEIRVDGKSVGYAPKRLELSTGAHDVRLLRGDGSEISARRFVIEAHHTQSAPLRFIVP